MAVSLQIQLLGEFRLSDGDALLSGVNTPRLQSLLAYLLLHRDAAQSRSHVAFQFWPDSTEAQARSNLRTLLHRLRRALPEPDTFLHVDTKTVHWRPDGPFRLDVADVEAALARAEGAERDEDEAGEAAALAQAVDAYQGDLLPSCYDDWLLPERERLLQAYLRAMERLIELLEGQRAYEEAIRYAQRLLRQDPLHEAGYRRLMRLRALQGDRAGALRVYHECATALQRQLGVEPGLATRRAYEDLLQAEGRPMPVRTASGVSPLVGREEEWTRLQTAWRRAARGPRMALLLGEAGIGKTRLVEEMLDWARRQGIAYAYARCYAGEGELAYAPVTALLRASPLPPLEDLWLTEVSRLLPEALTARPDLPPPKPMTEPWQRQRLFEALARATLGHDRPLLLVLDDLHWCDGETLDWLHFLLRFDPGARLLVIGTCRPEELDSDCAFASALPALHRDLRLDEIDLGPLDEAQTAELAASVAGRGLDLAAGRRLYNETEGNPLFVVETLRTGLPSAEDRPRVDKASLPARVQAVLETRLGQLSTPAREMAGLAATIGRSFQVRVLEEAGNGDGDDLVLALDELWQRRIVRERGSDAYDFTHDKLREAAYNTLSPARRRLMHRRVAAALESLHGSSSDVVAAQIAVHLDRAGMAEQAIPRYLEAGEAANRIYATGEAITNLQRGVVLLEQRDWGDDRQTWRREMEAGLYEGLGDALRRVARYTEAMDAYERARSAVPQDHILRHSLLLGKIGQTWWPQGDYECAVQALDEALVVLGPQPEEPDAAWWQVWGGAQQTLAYIYYFSNRTEELAKKADELAQGLERYWSPYLWFTCGTAQLQAALRRDRYVLSDESVADLLSMVDVADQLEDLDLKAGSYYGYGWMLQLHGELEGARSYLQEGVALAERTGNMVFLTWLLTWLSVLHRQCHEREASRQCAVRGVEVATIAGLAENAALARGNLAWCAWCDGDYDEVEEQGHAALALWAKSPFVYAFHWPARFPLLAVALERGQIAGAVEHARAMLDPLQQRLVEPVESALEDAVRASDADEAVAHLRRAVELAHEPGYL